MNFIATCVLSIVSEEEAFWMLVCIVEDLLPEDYYSSTMVLSEINVCAAY